MMSALSSRDARTLKVGGIALLVILIVGRGLPAALAQLAERRRIADVATAHAAQVERSIHNAVAVRRSLARVRSQLAVYDSALVDGATPSTASARLAELVADAADGTEAQVGSVRLSADSTAVPGGLAHVSARVSVSGDLAAIALMLQSLEAGPQLLAVRELTIAQTQPALAHGLVETLQVELAVEGLYRRRAVARAR